MDWSRAVRHLVAGRRGAHALVAPDTMQRLQAVIAAGETTHRGEVRLIVESAMPLRKIRRGMTTRQRALDLFGTFRVWDTEENNGVLLYLNIADRKLEIIADRAAARMVAEPDWQAVATTAMQAFHAGAYERGAADALAAIHRMLATAFPPTDGERRRNEIPDSPVVL